MPSILIDGLILGFISSSVTHLLPYSNYSKLQAGIFLIFLGLGAIIGGLLSGLLSDKLAIIKVGKSSFFLISICIFLSLPAILSLIEDLAYSYFLGFMWGFGWHYMDGWMWVTCSKTFHGKLESFALHKFFHSLSYMLYQFALMLYGSQNPLLFIKWFVFILIPLIVINIVFLLR